MKAVKNMLKPFLLLSTFLFFIPYLSTYANETYYSEEILIRKKLRENGKKLQENSKEIKSLLSELQSKLSKIEKDCNLTSKNKIKEEYCSKAKIFETWNYYIKLFDALDKQEKTLLQRYNLLQSYKNSKITNNQQEFNTFLKESKKTGKKLIAIYTSIKDILPEKEAHLLEKKIRNLKRYLKRQKKIEEYSAKLGNSVDIEIIRSNTRDAIYEINQQKEAVKIVLLGFYNNYSSLKDNLINISLDEIFKNAKPILNNQKEAIDLGGDTNEEITEYFFEDF